MFPFWEMSHDASYNIPSFSNFKPRAVLELYMSFGVIYLLLQISEAVSPLREEDKGPLSVWVCAYIVGAQ